MPDVTFERFRGLNLATDPQEIGGDRALAMLNADVTRQGTEIGARGGLSRLGTGTASYHRLFHTNDSLIVLRNTGSGILLTPVPVSTGTFGSTFPNAGAYGSSSSVATSAIQWNADRVFVATRSGSSNEIARSYEPVTSGMPAATILGSPRYFAATPWDNRLALAHFPSATATPSGANGSTATVFFSNPENWNVISADDWVELDGNDSDEITGVVSWREMLFVIKRTRLYVFYGTTTDSTGGAIFNYRTIDLPTRVRATTNGGGENMVAGGDGVYLLLSDGIYKTTGDVPQIVSREITPLFDGTGDSASLFPSTGNWTIGYATNRVYLSYQNGSAYRTLVYDTILREWLLWDISVGASAVPTNVIEWVDTNGLPTGYVACGAKLFSFTKTATSDDGTAISWHWQSGFYDLGSQHTKRTRRTALWGSGSPTLSIFTDHGTSDANAAAVTLGTAPAVARGWHSKAYRGVLFSHKLSGTSSATVHRVSHSVADERSGQ